MVEVLLEGVLVELFLRLVRGDFGVAVFLLLLRVFSFSLTEPLLLV